MSKKDEITEEEKEFLEQDPKFKKAMHKYCLELIGSDTDNV
jgi:hypothetical protein